MKAFGYELRIDRHSLWSCCHLIHYSGAMHTYWFGPFALVIDGREKARLARIGATP